MAANGVNDLRDKTGGDGVCKCGCCPCGVSFCKFPKLLGQRACRSHLRLMDFRRRDAPLLHRVIGCVTAAALTGHRVPFLPLLCGTCSCSSCWRCRRWWWQCRACSPWCRLGRRPWRRGRIPRRPCVWSQLAGPYNDQCPGHSGQGRRLFPGVPRGNVASPQRGLCDEDLATCRATI